MDPKPLALLVALLFAPFAGRLTAQSAPATLVRAAHLLDPRTGKVLSPSAVLIEDGKIKQVGTQINAPSGAKIVDLGAATLLPGLIDSHTHLFLSIVIPPEEELKRHLNPLF